MILEKDILQVIEQQKERLVSISTGQARLIEICLIKHSLNKAIPSKDSEYPVTKKGAPILPI